VNDIPAAISDDMNHDAHVTDYHLRLAACNASRLTEALYQQVYDYFWLREIAAIFKAEAGSDLLAMVRGRGERVRKELL
jgi:hypothetical protein